MLVEAVVSTAILEIVASRRRRRSYGKRRMARQLLPKNPVNPVKSFLLDSGLRRDDNAFI